MNPHISAKSLTALLDYVKLHGEIVGMTYTLSATLIHPQLVLHILAGNMWSMTFVKINGLWHLQRYSVDADGYEYIAKDQASLQRALAELNRIEGD